MEIPPTGARRSLPGRIPAPGLFAVSAVSNYFGAAVAVGLFVVMPPATVAWLRMLISALVLILWQRPWRYAWTKKTLIDACVFGTVLATMNTAFYIALDYLPLGTAVTIEFCGPIAVAAITGRGLMQRLALVMAAIGVILISGFGLTWSSSTAFGLIMIACAGTAWAVYILLGHRVATTKSSETQSPSGKRSPDGLATLSVGMTWAALAMTPLCIWWSAPVIHSWTYAINAIGVGVFSSAIPYALDQIIMRSLQPAEFALLSALLPAFAALIGFIVLQQIPTLAEIGGLIFISIAVAMTSAKTPAREP